MAQTDFELGRLEDKYFDNMLNKHLDGEGSDYSASDMRIATENATAYVVGDPENIEDVLNDFECADIYGYIALILRTQSERPRNYKEKNSEHLDALLELFSAPLNHRIEDRTEFELESFHEQF